jgi:Acetyltransferase (GNAT) domain
MSRNIAARGQGIGTAAVAALVRCLAAVPTIRRLTAVTGTENTASQRLLERQGFHLTAPLPGTDEVRYTLRQANSPKAVQTRLFIPRRAALFLHSGYRAADRYGTNRVLYHGRDGERGDAWPR